MELVDPLKHYMAVDIILPPNPCMNGGKYILNYAERQYFENLEDPESGTYITEELDESTTKFTVFARYWRRLVAYYNATCYDGTLKRFVGSIMTGAGCELVGCFVIQ